MRRLLSITLVLIALAAPAAAQEGNPCQASLTVTVSNPNQLAFYIEDLDKLGVTTLEYVTFLQGSTEPQSRTKIPRQQLASNGLWINCYTLTWAPPANLTKDGTTKYVIVARTEDAQARVSAWSSASNPFTLGTVAPPPPPLPLPVPGVRAGRTGA